MAEFLTTKSVQSNIESIIAESKKSIVIVSPFIKLSNYFMDNLAHASKRGVVVKILYGKSDLHPTVLGNIASLKNVQIYYFEHLHAKCYLNESKMIITSMNLYDASEKNREMGVSVQRDKDKDLFDKACYEVDLILQSQQTTWLNKPKTNQITPRKRNDFVQRRYTNNLQSLEGTCIRCGTNLKYDPDKPFCATCYKKWAEYTNPCFIENYCHSCGDNSHTSMEKPECYECYTLAEA